jgi:hypothetical protein
MDGRDQGPAMTFKSEGAWRARSHYL